MNSKNIKKALNGKLTKWLESVDCKNIKSIIKENAIISGGAIVSLLTNIEVNDYDVYFRTRESALEVAKYYVTKFNEAHKSKAYVNEKENGKIEVFIKSHGIEECEEIEESFLPNESKVLSDSLNPPPPNQVMKNLSTDQYFCQAMPFPYLTKFKLS